MNPEALAGYDRRIGVRVEKRARRLRADRRAEPRGQRRRLRDRHDAMRSRRAGKCSPTGRRAAASPPSCAPSNGSKRTTGAAATSRKPSARFIQDAYAKWGVRYVLLAGDTDILPARYGYSGVRRPHRDATSRPTLYFACLDGNWNSDGDARVRRSGVSVSRSRATRPTSTPKCYVGRVPVEHAGRGRAPSSPRSMTYENPTQTSPTRTRLCSWARSSSRSTGTRRRRSLDGRRTFCEEMAAYPRWLHDDRALVRELHGLPGLVPAHARRRRSPR